MTQLEVLAKELGEDGGSSTAALRRMRDYLAARFDPLLALAETIASDKINPYSRKQLQEAVAKAREE